MRLSWVPLSSLVTSSLATKLYVSSYGGNITSLQLNQDQSGSYSLRQVAVNNGSLPNPSSLTKNPNHDIVYCVDEGLTVMNGSLTSYITSVSGALTQIDRHEVPPSPVSSIVYNCGKALAVAHYGDGSGLGGSVTTWQINSSGTLELLQTLPFNLSTAASDAVRQPGSRPHQALIDPTDRFVLVPDLGADLVRVFSIDSNSSLLTESAPLKAPAGSGPRHAAFIKSTNNTYFFLVTEFGNTIASYNVSYGENGLSFTCLYESGIYGPRVIPPGAAAAEVVVSPDQNYLLTSSRNDTLFDIPNFDSNNSTKIPSDTLQVWKIDHETGELGFEQLAAAGGSFPRQFSINKDGTLAAVGLQKSSRVVILERDVKSGKYEDFVAEIEIPGEVTSVIWDE